MCRVSHHQCRLWPRLGARARAQLDVWHQRHVSVLRSDTDPQPFPDLSMKILLEVGGLARGGDFAETQHIDMIGHSHDPSNIMVYQQYAHARSAEHTSELQSIMRISYAVFCLHTKNNC